MSGDFIDSNVFVYLLDTTDRRRDRAQEVVNRALQSGDGRISYQVVQETLKVITTKIATQVTPADAVRFLDSTLLPLWHVHPSPQLFRSALNLNQRYRIPFYDSLIVAAALEAGCDRLVSEDFQHGQRIEGLTFHNPFF